MNLASYTVSESMPESFVPRDHVVKYFNGTLRGGRSAGGRHSLAVLGVVSAREMISAGRAENAMMHWTSGCWQIVEIHFDFQLVEDKGDN